MKTSRREFLGLAAGSLAFAAQDDVRIGPRRKPTEGFIAPDFLGLGYEISSVARPGLLDRDNAVYVQLVRTLSPRGVIRIGGNTADYAHYSANAAPVSKSKSTIVNDAVLNDLGGFLDATGWKLIWALNLGTGSEEEALAEATAVMRAAGPNLLAFEIGNEPDLFSRQKHRPENYSYDGWLADYRRYKNVLRAKFPKIPFAGPDAARATDWVTRFAAGEGRDAVLLTHHYYREGQNPSSSIEKLLGVDPKLAPELAALREASQKSHRPYRICEVNSFSGGGRPGVSDTLAGALWAWDYMMTLAVNGCAGVNMETGVNQLDFISSYSPIGDDEHGHYTAKPEYYGMLAFSLAGEGSVVELESPVAEVKAYRTTRAVSLINKSAIAQKLTVSSGLPAAHATITRLTGPSIDAKSGVTLGGAEVQPSGEWKPSNQESIALHRGEFRIELAPYSGAVVLVGQA